MTYYDRVEYWSPWVYKNGNGLRVGATVYEDDVWHDEYDFDAHIHFYTQNQYHFDGDYQQLVLSGDLNATVGYNNWQGHGEVEWRASRDLTHVYTTWGTSPGTWTVWVEVQGAYNGSNPKLRVDIPIPPRPVARPNSPTNVTAVRGATDATTVVSWTRQSTAPRPYRTVTVQFREYTPDYWSNWADAGVVDGSASSFTHTNRVGNRIYEYRVRADNAAGSSGWVYPPSWVYTTPAAPADVTTTKIGATNAAVVGWRNQAAVGVPTITHSIERSVGGGAWAQVASGLSWSTTSWTDPNPGAGTTVQYRVKTVVSVGGLSSVWAVGPLLSTAKAPLAPTLLAPNGTAVDAQYTSPKLTWAHNHAGDFAAQSHFTIQTSTNGGVTWQALVSNVESTVSEYTIPPGVRVNGPTYLWRVSTQGGTSAAYSPWSAAASFTAHTTPTVTLSEAEPAPETLSLPLTARWAYAQAQSSGQAQWVAELYTGDGAVLLESRSAFDTAESTAFTYPVLDDTPYFIRVRAMSGSGLWSAWASAVTMINLPPPAAAHTVVEYQPCSGTMTLAITVDAPIPGETDVDYVVIERRVNGGPWTTLVRDLPPPTTFVDMLPVTNGLNEYRVTSISTAPSFRVNPVVEAPGTDGRPGGDRLWVFLSYGQGFTRVLRVRSDLSVVDKPARVNTTRGFLGRVKPVGLVGVGTTREVAVSARLGFGPRAVGGGGDCVEVEDPCVYDSPPVGWVNAARDAGVVCYRDYTGRRLFGLLSGLDTGDEAHPGVASLGFTVTEIDYTEPTGVLPEVTVT